ncbi:VOC family protein [Shimia sp. R9_1]|uniref:VOC family protein n=1 Tax=unclassified Shimia TaxID=2630038 RepID=UPI001ADD51F2|nr:MULTISPECIES: VOC family protein [unclassified Shimia]MBO9398506.1 VOC family protein [Shimia sp. R9_2]MBO9409439.1 VOC family protein [Shimia sp. R9_1]
MAKMVHSCIRVLEDDRSIAWYKSAFDLDIVDQLDFESFRLTYLANKESGFELELTLNKDRTTPYELGDGYAHLAFVVEDVTAYHKTMIAKGLDVGELVEFAPDGELVARFFFATDPDGYKIEVLQKAGRFK